MLADELRAAIEELADAAGAPESALAGSEGTVARAAEPVPTAE